MQTARDPESRYQAKRTLVRRLYGAGHNANQVREAFRLGDWMMQSREDLDARVERELVEFAEEIKMPYVTSVERIAEARGREKGRHEG